MGKIHMSNSEREARFKNVQEQERLRKQLEKLSLKEINNKNLGRVEAQKWRQFMKDCVKNTGSCSMVMEEIRKGNYDNIPLTEPGHVLSRHKSLSETQIYIHRRKDLSCSFRCEQNHTTCSECTDAEEISQLVVQPGRSPGLSKSFSNMTTREALKYHLGNRKPKLGGSTRACVQPSPPLASSRSVITRTSAASSPVTELMEDAKLALSKPASISHLPTPRLTSYLPNTPAPTRFVSTCKPRQVHLVADFTFSTDLQQASESSLGLSNDTNNLLTMKLQRGWYSNDKIRNAQQVHENDLHSYKLPCHVKKTVTYTGNIIPRLSSPLTSKSEPVEKCWKSLSIAETYNSQEGRTREKLGLKGNKKGEIIYYNTTNQSNPGVVSHGLLKPGYLEMASGSRTTVEQEGYGGKEHIYSDFTPELIDTNHASNSVEDRHKRKIQFLRELSRKNQTLLNSHLTEGRIVKSSTSNREPRKPITSLEVSACVTISPHARNEPNREVMYSAGDKTTDHLEQKGRERSVTAIDLHQFAQQFQVTRPGKDNSGGYDSKNLILAKAPLLSQSLQNPDRIMNSPLCGLDNPLTCDQNSRRSYDGQKLGTRHFKERCSSDYKIGQHSSHSDGPDLTQVAIQLRNRKLNIKGNNKMSVFGNDDRCTDKNLLVKSASRRRTMSTILPENMTEKYATDTATDRLSRSLVGLFNSSTGVIKRQVDDLKDSDKRQVDDLKDSDKRHVGNLKDSDSYRHDHLTKQMTERLELRRPVNNRQMSNATRIEASPTPARQNLENPDAFCILDLYDDTPCCITDQCDDTLYCITDQCDDTLCCITDQCDDTPCCITDQCDDTLCCITDQCDDTLYCITDQCDDTLYCITDQCDDTLCCITDQCDDTPCCITDQCDDTPCCITDQCDDTLCSITDQCDDALCYITDRCDDTPRCITDQCDDTLCCITDRSVDTPCCITDQCDDTPCCITDQCDDTLCCITDRCDDTPTSVADVLHSVHNSGGRLSRVRQGKQPPNNCSDNDQSSLFRIVDIKSSGQPSRVLDRELSKQSSLNEQSCVLYSQVSKQLSRNERSRESINLILDNKHLKKPKSTLSDNKLCKDTGHYLTLDSKHCNKSAHMFSDVNISRDSSQGSPNVEMSRQANAILKETSEASFSAPQRRDSANCLAGLSEFKQSAIVLSDINHFRESTNTNTHRQLNTVVSDKIKNAANKYQRFAKKTVFSRGEYGANLEESSDINDNNVDNNNVTGDKGVLTSHILCNTNHNMIENITKERFPSYTENTSLFEASPRVSNIRDLKMASVMKASREISGQVKTADSSLLSRDKNVTTENWQPTRKRHSDCTTGQHHKHLHNDCRTDQHHELLLSDCRAGQHHDHSDYITVQHHEHLLKSWQTVGGRLIAGRHVQKWTATSDVMMSRRARQRAINKMVEDNLKRPINSQQVLANESLRMRVEEFLRSL